MKKKEQIRIEEFKKSLNSIVDSIGALIKHSENLKKIIESMDKSNPDMLTIRNSLISENDHLMNNIKDLVQNIIDSFDKEQKFLEEVYKNNGRK